MPRNILLGIFWILAWTCLVLAINSSYSTVSRIIKNNDYSDLHIFIEAGARFKKTGDLYDKPSPGDEFPIEAMFRPSGSMFKFPPAFQLQLLPFTSELPTADFYKKARLFMAIIYLASCFMIARKTLQQWKNQGKLQTFTFLIVTTVLTLCSDGFYSAISLINYEIPIFFMLIVAYSISNKAPILSGIIVAYLAASKIYPGFMVLFFLATNNKKATIGFLSGFLFFISSAFFIFGENENSFYYKKILPILIKEKVSTEYFNINIGNMLNDITNQKIEIDSFFSVTRMIFISLTLILLIENNKKKIENQLEVFSILLVLMVACLPNYWQAYQILFFPALAISAKKTISKPRIGKILFLAIIIASLSIDINSWVHLYHIPGISNNNLTEEAWRNLLFSEIGSNNSSRIYQLILHNPVNFILFILAKFKSIIPYALWCILALEIRGSHATRIQT